MAGRTANEVDELVGARIKALRRAKQLSQEALGQKLGVTFQQVQKYENGSNRVSASRLLAISRILDVDVHVFFDSVESTETLAWPPGSGIDREIVEFLRSPDGQALNQWFSRIPSAATRFAVLRLVEAIAAQHSGE